VHDRSNGKTERVSVSTGGDQARATRDPWGSSIAGGISANGRYIVFQSDAPNLVPATPTVSPISSCTIARAADEAPQRRLARPTNGASGAATISASGRYVAFSPPPRTSSAATRITRWTSSSATSPPARPRA
jgi:hypothetical protein